MGYEIAWKIKDLPEIDSKFKGYWSKNPKEDIQEEKNQILLFCMNCNKENILYKELTFKLKLFINLLEQQWKWNLKQSLENEEKEEFWYCGWEYSKDNIVDYDSIINKICKEIYLYTFCTHDLDILNEESNFWIKYDNIERLLDELDENVTYKWNHDFVDTYRNNCIKYEDEL